METRVFTGKKKTRKNSKRFLVEVCALCLLYVHRPTKQMLDFTTPINSQNSTHRIDYKMSVDRCRTVVTFSLGPL